MVNLYDLIPAMIRNLGVSSIPSDRRKIHEAVHALQERGIVKGIPFKRNGLFPRSKEVNDFLFFQKFMNTASPERDEYYVDPKRTENPYKRILEEMGEENLQRASKIFGRVLGI